MLSTSAIVNKSFRKIVSPTLRTAGFEKIDARNGWRWIDKTIWVFNIRAVGSYFSEATGWPPGSVGVWLGVFYTFMPNISKIKTDEKGRLTPAEYMCQMRTHLDCNVNQKEKLARLPNAAERRRIDIWWVEPDGENADEMAKDIRESLLEQGIPWFTQATNPVQALALIESEHDCFNKYVRAYFLAKEIGDEKRYRKYVSLAEAESKRIGESLDPKTWHVST